VPLDRISSILRKAESYIKNNLGGEADNDILERMLEVLGSSLHSNHYLLAQVEIIRKMPIKYLQRIVENLCNFPLLY